MDCPKKITFWIQTSITASIKDKDLILLKKAGLVRVSFGVERFSTDFRERMEKKSVRVSKSLVCCEQLKKMGL